MTHAVVAILVVSFVVATLLAYRHQCLLRDRARLMHDAIRHRDFSFRLPTKGLLFGERALQETLNEMGGDIQKLVAQGEVESWQRLTRVLTHEIMNATTPKSAIPIIIALGIQRGAVIHHQLQLITFVNFNVRNTRNRSPVKLVPPN